MNDRTPCNSYAVSYYLGEKVKERKMRNLSCSDWQDEQYSQYENLKVFTIMYGIFFISGKYENSAD